MPKAKQLPHIGLAKDARATVLKGAPHYTNPGPALTRRAPKIEPVANADGSKAKPRKPSPPKPPKTEFDWIPLCSMMAHVLKLVQKNNNDATPEKIHESGIGWTHFIKAFIEYGTPKLYWGSHDELCAYISSVIDDIANDKIDVTAAVPETFEAIIVKKPLPQWNFPMTEAHLITTSPPQVQLFPDPAIVPPPVIAAAAPKPSAAMSATADMDDVPATQPDEPIPDEELDEEETNLVPINPLQ